MDGLEWSERRWAEEEFASLKLGDARRTKRLVKMATRVSEKPAGKVSDVFPIAKEQQAAYDFLEETKVKSERLMAHVALMTLNRVPQEEYLFTAIDGSSLGLTDRTKKKNFGSVGSHKEGGRGLKVISALGMDSQGVVVGLVSQVWWARKMSKRVSHAKKVVRNAKRKTQEKETQRWLDCIEECRSRAQRAARRLWMILDRESDNRDILLKLAEGGEEERFTARSSWDRNLEPTKGKKKEKLRSYLKKQKVVGYYELPVSAGPNRRKRVARMSVRFGRVTLSMRHPWTKTIQRLELTAVWAREVLTTPRWEKAIDWLLLTNAPVTSLAEAMSVVQGYAMRWRIEEFHKTWKSGACNVEQTQLRDAHAVKTWATLLATVAARIERLKQLARTQPQLPATEELSDLEMRTLVMVKRTRKKKNEVIPDTVPTMEQAVRWIAEMGGYTGKSSGGPPGSITLARGLDALRKMSSMLAILESQPFPRQK